MIDVTHLFIDIEEINGEAFHALWAALLFYYGPVLPPLTVFHTDNHSSIIDEKTVRQLKNWEVQMNEIGRVVATSLFPTIVECLILDIPHLHCKDHMCFYSSSLEIFFRRSLESDNIQLQTELCHCFFLPLLETLKRKSIQLDDFPLQITYVSKSGFLTTDEIANVWDSLLPIAS